MQVPANMAVVTQGEPGDAFYIVLTGTLDVLVGTTNVNTMVSGTTFGEKALENDAPRSATVVAAEPCKLLVLLASDYKSLATHAQLRMNKDLAAFLMAECSAFKQFSISRVLNIIKLVVRKKFKKGDQVLAQNDRANGLCILLKGRVRLRRTISVKVNTEHYSKPSHHPNLSYPS
jgi:CRP-like cAMP-binding protein